MGDYNDDRYFWTPKSNLTIAEYLKKTRPSIVTDNDTPWIWIQGTQGHPKDPERDDSKTQAVGEAKRLLTDLEKRLKGVDTDDSIPIRASKGKKSKKAVRDEMLDEAKKNLKDLSIKSKWTCGKWLLFPRHGDVDGTWAKLGESVANGPLKDAGVFLAKVATTPGSLGEGEDPTHVICLYMHDIYDLNVVRKVLETMLKSHGVEPSACKSDLYTMAGIDSNHPTKLRSTIWRPAEVIEGGVEAVKALRAQYKSTKSPNDNGKKKATITGMIESDSEDERIAEMAKRKSRSPVKRDMEEKDEKESTKRPAGNTPRSNGKENGPPVKKSKSAAVKYQEQDIFGGWSDSD